MNCNKDHHKIVRPRIYFLSELLRVYRKIIIIIFMKDISLSVFFFFVHEIDERAKPVLSHVLTTIFPRPAIAEHVWLVMALLSHGIKKSRNLEKKMNRVQFVDSFDCISRTYDADNL